VYKESAVAAAPLLMNIKPPPSEHLPLLKLLAFLDRCIFWAMNGIAQATQCFLIDFQVSRSGAIHRDNDTQ
jgi:hypothetical protein